MTAPDETVYIVRTQHTNRRRHTDIDCENLPNDTSRIRSVEFGKLNDSYALCKVCSDGSPSGEIGTVRCPGCGQAVNANALRSHLPCDGESETGVVGDD